MAIDTQSAHFSYFHNTCPIKFQETARNCINLSITLNFNTPSKMLADPDITEDLFDSFHRKECEIRPHPDYMRTVQKKNLITPRTRAMCVNWLAGIAESIGLKGDTLHMAIGYLDRYLSEEEVETLMLGQIGIACLMLAAKYDEEDSPVGFNVFLSLTDDFITRKDLVDLEWSVWSTIGFNLTPPTAHRFLMRYLRAAQGGAKIPIENLENMAFFLAELALASYDMIRFPPSTVAAAVVFLARYALDPARKPWSATLHRYSYYKAAELRNCVMALHRFWMGSRPWTQEIRNKYGMAEYGRVALKSMPRSVPAEAFES